MKYKKVPTHDGKETETQESIDKHIVNLKKAILEAEYDLVKFIRKKCKYAYSVGDGNDYYTSFERAKKRAYYDAPITVKLSKNVNEEHLLNINT